MDSDASKGLWMQEQQQSDRHTHQQEITVCMQNHHSFPLSHFIFELVLDIIFHSRRVFFPQVISAAKNLPHPLRMICTSRFQSQLRYSFTCPINQSTSPGHTVSQCTVEAKPQHFWYEIWAPAPNKCENVTAKISMHSNKLTLSLGKRSSIKLALILVYEGKPFSNP